MCQRGDVGMAFPKKRKHSGEENLPEKRQKQTTEAKSITALIGIRETTTSSKVSQLIRENTTSRVRRHDTNAKPRGFTRKPDKSVTALVSLREKKADSKITRLIRENTAWRIRDHDTKTKGEVNITKPAGDKIEKQNNGFKDLIAKAREKLQEKRQVDDRNTDITNQRIAARLALDQIVETDDDIDDHLKYHTELQNLGCDFINDQVSCLKMFSLLTRRDYYIDESNLSHETKELPTVW